MTIFSRQEAVEASRHEILQPWMLFWHGMFYVSLIVATGISLTLGSSSWQGSLILCVLSLLLGIWYAACIVWPQYWQRHTWLTLGYLLIGWAIWFELAGLEPVYLFVLTGLYPQVYILPLFPWNLVGGFILLGVSLYRQGSWNEGAFFILGTGIAGMVLALFIHTILYQSRERARLIDELQATRRELAMAERQAGIMQERQRLAHEIHDTFTQGFTGIMMQIEVVEASLSTDTNVVRRALDQVRRISRENLAEARRLLWALQPEALKRAPLPDTLISLTQRWAEESGISAHAAITGTVFSLRPEVEVTLLRIAQEALANVHKHAQASSMMLTLSYMEDIVALDIQDDGIGFNPECLPASPFGQTTGGFGLKALRERIEQLQGTLTLESTPNEGTTIAVTLPAVRNVPQPASEIVQGSRL